jgi:hypothetical protein
MENAHYSIMTIYYLLKGHHVVNGVRKMRNAFSGCLDSL